MKNFDRSFIKTIPAGILLIAIFCLATPSLLSNGQQVSSSLQASRNRLASRAAAAANTTTERPKPIGRSSNASTIRERSAAAAAAATSNGLNSTNGRLEIVEDELPADFYEMPPEQLDLGMNATGRAPTPILNVVVLQNGQMIDSTVNVQPGTPLEMVIYLDDKSAKVYGLLVSFLKVKDDTVRQREEVIITNACSIDTYIFGNFELNPEDQTLRAKFRAFKFPDSNFVKFVGTVNVCIKQCAKVNCGSTRKRRHSSNQSSSTKDNRLVFTVSTVLRIGNFKSEPIRVRR